MFSKSRNQAQQETYTTVFFGAVFALNFTYYWNELMLMDSVQCSLIILHAASKNCVNIESEKNAIRRALQQSKSSHTT